MTLLNTAKAVAHCILRRAFSAAAEQRKLQFFLSTFRQNSPPQNPKRDHLVPQISRCPSRARSIFGSNLLRRLHMQNEYSAAKSVTAIGGVGGAVHAATAVPLLPTAAQTALVPRVKNRTHYTSQCRTHLDQAGDALKK